MDRYGDDYGYGYDGVHRRDEGDDADDDDEEEEEDDIVYYDDGAGAAADATGGLLRWTTTAAASSSQPNDNLYGGMTMTQTQESDRQSQQSQPGSQPPTTQQRRKRSTSAAAGAGGGGPILLPRRERRLRRYRNMAEERRRLNGGGGRGGDEDEGEEEREEEEGSGEDGCRAGRRNASDDEEDDDDEEEDAFASIRSYFEREREESRNQEGEEEEERGESDGEADPVRGSAADGVGSQVDLDIRRSSECGEGGDHNERSEDEEADQSQRTDPESEGRYPIDGIGTDGIQSDARGGSDCDMPGASSQVQPDQCDVGERPDNANATSAPGDDRIEASSTLAPSRDGSSNVRDYRSTSSINDGEDIGGGIDMDLLREQTLRRMQRHSNGGRGRAVGSGSGGGTNVAHDDLTDITNTRQEATVLEAARRDHRHLRQRVAGGVDGAASKQVGRGVSGMSVPTAAAGARGAVAESAVGVKSAKSIVGSRPKHWGPSNRSSGQPSRISHSWHPSRGNQSLSSRASALSEATKIRPNRSMMARSGVKRSRSASRADSRSISIDESTKVPPPKVHAPVADQSSSPAAHPASQMSPPNRQGDDRGNKSNQGLSMSSNRWEQNADVRNMQFAPAFLGRPSSDGIRDDVATLTASSITMTPNHGRRPLMSQAGSSSVPCMTPVNFEAHSATPARRPSRNGSTRKRTKAGPLTMQLRSIRSSLEGDCVRLQSGTYPFMDPSKRRMDVNDPRNRATMHMDVTIVGDPFPWKGRVERVTVLGYVHSVVFKDGKTGANGSNAGAASTFAWICLGQDMMNGQRGIRGTQLRVYDPIRIDSTQFVSEDESIPVIVCTKVCEGYPSSLPPLSNIPPLDTRWPLLC